LKGSGTLMAIIFGAQFATKAILRKAAITKQAGTFVALTAPVLFKETRVTQLVLVASLTIFKVLLRFKALAL